MGREIKLKALAPDKQGNLTWFEDVFTDGATVYLDTKHMGMQPLKNVKAIVEFTGLHDKNGQEIYEGDIVANYAMMDKVVFENGAFVGERSMRDKLGQKQPIAVHDELEVIGNIWDNPKLLAGES
jgi:uncharacterized phage protein (TIGR01671 family)